MNILQIVISVVTGFLVSLVQQVNISFIFFSHGYILIEIKKKGFAVITLKEAALFTDGRYFLQASQQLDNNWTLMKQGNPGVPTWQEYLVKVQFFFYSKYVLCIGFIENII